MSGQSRPLLEYVIELVDDWQPDDSEMTVYRRVATVMDYLFRSTDVKLMDGESASQCTKSARQYMENVFGGSIPDTAHGRKIDLILKRASNGGDIELSSNEFKRQRVSSTCALAQQCKNLRTNGAILAHLEAIDNQHRHRHVVAMDWIGNVGYLYMLANVEGVYVADKLCILRLPRCLNDVATFKPTLEALFRYQCFITQLGHQSLSMLQAREDLESLCGIVDTGSEAIPDCQTPDILRSSKSSYQASEGQSTLTCCLPIHNILSSVACNGQSICYYVRIPMNTL